VQRVTPVNARGHLRGRYQNAGPEAAVKVCGVAAAMLPGYSWVPHRLIG